MEQTIINALESIHAFLTGNVALWAILSAIVVVGSAISEWRKRELWH